MKYLVAAPGTSPDDARALALANGCAGYYLDMPPVWQAQASDEGWTLPCVVTLGDEGTVANWTPV
jgi:hypothetical protein